MFHNRSDSSWQVQDPPRPQLAADFTQVHVAHKGDVCAESLLSGLLTACVKYNRCLPRNTCVVVQTPCLFPGSTSSSYPSSCSAGKAGNAYLAGGEEQSRALRVNLDVVNGTSMADEGLAAKSESSSWASLLEGLRLIGHGDELALGLERGGGRDAAIGKGPGGR